MVVCYVFFFKQKTAYEMLRSLVGSEMCIRDSAGLVLDGYFGNGLECVIGEYQLDPIHLEVALVLLCLLYTSDAADDLLCVDLGGRRIITKKKTH